MEIIEFKPMFTVAFTPEDWTTGLAAACIAMLKELPKGSKFYLPDEKCWRVTKSKAPDAITKIRELEEAFSKKEEDDSFDVEEWLSMFDRLSADEWLDKTFGNNEIFNELV